MSDPIEAPEPYASIIDEVCAADAAWFAAHPGEEEFTRPYCDGEFWPAKEVLEGEIIAVRVRLLGPGIRTREIVSTGPILMLADPAEAERMGWPPPATGEQQDHGRERDGHGPAFA